MRNILILHGTNNSSRNNWFRWLGDSLQKKGWKVLVPDLPHAEKPSIGIYNQFLLDVGWELNSQSVIVGHSSGAVATLGLLQNLPEHTIVDVAVLVGAFKDDLGNTQLTQLFEKPFDFEKIKRSAKRFVLIHSDNDPYCPLEHAEYLAEKLGGELLVKSGEAHFSISTAGEKYKEFPLLLEILDA